MHTFHFQPLLFPLVSVALPFWVFSSFLGLICFFFFNTRLCGCLSTENIQGFAMNLLAQLFYLLLNLNLHLLPCSGLNRSSTTHGSMR